MTDTKDLRDEFALAVLPDIAKRVGDALEKGIKFTRDGEEIRPEKYVAGECYSLAEAMMTERLGLKEPQAEPWEAAHGYQEAFYKIAEILGVGALPTTPAQAFASVIVPKLRELMAAHGRAA